VFEHVVLHDDINEEFSEEEKNNAVLPNPAPLPAPYQYREEEKHEENKKHEEVVLTQAEQEERTARWLGRVSAIAVFFGVAFFLKYAFDNDWILPAGRVAIGVFAGVATLVLGQKLRAKYLNYSDMLMGIGLGILYLAMYASYGYYHLISADVAFFFMGMVTALGMLIAVSGGTLGVAILATLGGFLTPIMLSTGENHLAGLSFYMLMLDLGVFGVAWHKKWISLQYLSFIGTLFLFGGWLNRFYTEAQLGETFFFITMFFALFLVTGMLHHLVRKEKTKPADIILITLNAGGYFWVGMQLLALHHHDLIGFFALILALVYLFASYAAHARHMADRTLNLFLPGIAVVFLTVAVPYQLSGYGISLAWLAEAVALTGIGLYLGNRTIQVFGWIVLMLGMSMVAREVGMSRSHGYLDITPFWNIGFFLEAVTVAALYGMGGLYFRFRSSVGEWRPAMLIGVVLANLVTMYTLGTEISLHHEYWSPIVWLAHAVILLAIGLVTRVRIIEYLGWIIGSIGVVMIFNSLTGIRRTSGGVSAFFNLGFFLMTLSVLTVYAFAGTYRKIADQKSDWKQAVSVAIVLANIMTIFVGTSEIVFKYDQDVARAYAVQSAEISKTQKAQNNYYGGLRVESNYNNYAPTVPLGIDRRATENQKNTAISIFWALYATLLLVLGFMKQNRILRLFGLIFFFITGGKVFIEVWALGPLYRIISSLLFGVIGLAASFLYAKYKHRLKEIIYD